MIAVAVAVDENRWDGRPGLAACIRLLAFLLPVQLTVLTAAVLAHAIDRPSGTWPLVGWWAGITAAATLVLVGADRAARRVLPLALLYRLSLVFPDRAPSRFSVAFRSASTRHLERWLQEAHDAGKADDVARAAETVLTLAAALNIHDRQTRGHSERVRAFTDLIAEELHLSDDDRNHLRWAGLLHDIGKLSVTPSLLNKRETLDADDWAALHRHPLEGARLAGPLLEWLGDWGPTIAQHHEHFDGTGYPNGLAGEEICLGARIVAVADSYDTMTTARVYKRPLSVKAARAELAECAGTHFDPKVVRAFLNVSLGRVRLIMGPAPWLAQIPIIGALGEAGPAAGLAAESAGVAVKTAAVVGTLAAGGTFAPAATASAPPSTTATTTTVVEAAGATPVPVPTSAVASAPRTSASNTGSGATTAQTNPSGNGGTLPPTSHAGSQSPAADNPGSSSSSHPTVPVTRPTRGASTNGR